jgi:hypothetical protein
MLPFIDLELGDKANFYLRIFTQTVGDIVDYMRR